MEKETTRCDTVTSRAADEAEVAVRLPSPTLRVHHYLRITCTRVIDSSVVLSRYRGEFGTIF